MGAGAGSLGDTVDKKTAEDLFGKCFDEELFNKDAKDGIISKDVAVEHLRSIARGPRHVLLVSAQDAYEGPVKALAAELKKRDYEVKVTSQYKKADLQGLAQGVEEASVVVYCLSAGFASDQTVFAQVAYAKMYGAIEMHVKAMEGYRSCLKGETVDKWMSNFYSGADIQRWDAKASPMDLADKITERAGPSLKALNPIEHTVESGDKYTGLLVDGKMHGYGKLVYTGKNAGRVHEGFFNRGRRHGKGKCVYPNKDVFDGTFENDKYVGLGTYVSDGNEYCGNYEAGKRNGYGVCKYGASGDKYEGLWKDDEYSGWGRYTWSDGGYYQGEYQIFDGTSYMHGKGIMINDDATVAHDGAFEKNEPV